MKHRTIFVALTLSFFTFDNHHRVICQTAEEEQIVQQPSSKTPVLSFRTGRVLFVETTEAEVVSKRGDIGSRVHASTSPGILLYGSVGGAYTPADYRLPDEGEIAAGEQENSPAQGLDPNLPTEYALFQNYPNPFNPSTMLRFDLPEESHVRISIFDVLGRVLISMVDEKLSAGRHGQLWEGRNRDGLQVSAGVYFYWIEARSLVSQRSLIAVKKMLLLK